MASRPKDIPAIEREAILAQLERILSSPSFKSSERSSKLLQFLVEQSIGGHADRLKEYTLGIEALGKSSAFDPRTDPSVRSEASRLRTRLDKYYAAEGKADPIVIVLPKGTYALRFENRQMAADAHEEGPSVDRPTARPWITRSKPAAAFAALGIALVAAVALVSWWDSAPWNPAQREATERSAAASPASAVTIAVLPFENLSGDPAQEFFSDGITEEIGTVLARVPALRMVGRGSAFQFKQQNRDLRAIGRSLDAAYLIEGSVRRSGDRVRVTAQLVKVEDGLALWTDAYDRELKDLLATQEDIAQAIAGALRAPLNLQSEHLIANRTVDPESYQQYLRARALVRSRGIDSLTQAAGLLEQVVAHEPEFAPAWALLAQAYALTPVFHPAVQSSSVDELREVVDATLPRAEAAARRAIALEPDNADGYLSLGLVQDQGGKFQLAEQLYAKALAIDSNNPDGLHRKGLLLAEVGRVKDALAVLQELRAMEPFVPIYNANLASVLMLNGRDEEARALLKTLPPVTVIGLGERLALLDAASGRYADAIEDLRTLPRDGYPPRMVDEAVSLLRSAPTAKHAPDDSPYLGTLGFVYLYAGAPDRVLDVYDKHVAASYLNAVIALVLWHESVKPVRDTERFKTLVRKAGLVDYWRTEGWPEFCRPSSGDDFHCS